MEAPSESLSPPQVGGHVPARHLSSPTTNFKLQSLAKSESDSVRTESQELTPPGSLSCNLLPAASGSLLPLTQSGFPTRPETRVR